MLWIAFIVALATAEPSASAREEAEAAFRTATVRFAEEDYEAALANFREAYRHAPHDKVRFNIGQCLNRLGRWHEAWVELDAAARSEQLSDGERTTARVAADEAASHLGTLRLTGSARQVIVDDDAGCVVPCTVLVVPGSHTVRIEGEPASVHEVRVGEVTEVAIGPAPPRVPPPTAATPSPARLPIEDRPPPRARPSALTWVGLGLAVGGGAGMIGFGVRANALHDDYIAGPDPATRDKGITMRNLANASIAVALLGAVLVTADVIRIVIKRKRARQ
jgi:hypothetical protein